MNKASVGSTAYGAPSPENCQAGTLRSKPHAVVTAGSNSYSYDCNGNMTVRTIGGVAYTLTGVYPERSRRDAENRLTGISGGGVTASYTYDGDGNRVKAVIGSNTMVYVGTIYEQTTSGTSTTITKYYQAGSQRIALRVNGVVRWLATDHLGSTSVTANESGARIAELRYKPWGESRYTFGATPTQRRFTGQVLDNVAGGLYFYNARYYDPALARFTQADTIVPQPGNPQSLNRYSYALNSPVRFTDPSGHFTADEICTYFVNCGTDKEQWEAIAKRALGSLFDLLWGTPITWGDVLFMGNQQGVTSAAMFILMTDSDNGSSGYYAGLWGLSGQGADMPLTWQSAQQAATLAAYSVQGNSWEGMARRHAETWVGDDWMQTLPTINGAWSLHKKPESANYHFST